MKEFIWKLLPGFIRRAWSGSGAEKRSGWFGNYSAWEEASEAATGYDSALILEKVRQSLLKVKRGEAAFERDSVAFKKLDSDPELRRWLEKISDEKNNTLRVLDFGGSLGSSYFQYSKALKNVSFSNWTVVEQLHFVEAGRRDFQDDILKFETTPEAAFANEKPDVLLLFSVLPYLKEPFQLLEKLVRLNPEYIIVDRTPVLAAMPTRLTVQIVPEHIYKASYPAWLFNEKQLLEAFREKYEHIAEFRSKFAAPYLLEDGTKAEWKGFVFKRRSV